MTRIAAGLKDEDYNGGYFGSDMGQKIGGSLTNHERVALANNEKDGEPDIFFYSLNGFSGRFVFDKDKKPVMLDQANLKVLNSPFKKELGMDGWLFGDAIGTRFFVGNSSAARDADRYSDYSPYSYVLNNPISYTDPTGMDPFGWIRPADGGLPFWDPGVNSPAEFKAKYGNSKANTHDNGAGALKRSLVCE